VSIVLSLLWAAGFLLVLSVACLWMLMTGYKLRR
jgi:hypothetical protein